MPSYSLPSQSQKVLTSQGRVCHCLWLLQQPACAFRRDGETRPPNCYAHKTTQTLEGLLLNTTSQFKEEVSLCEISS